MTDAMVNSLQNMSGIDDTDNSGDVSSGDFVTPENMQKLQQYLLEYSPASSNIYSTWMGETEGRLQYEDGRKRIKKCPRPITDRTEDFLTHPSEE